MNHQRKIPLPSDIESCYRVIKPHIHQTPVLTSEKIDQITGSHLYFKCENFQKSGAFKYRGATNALLNLSGETLKKPVITHSSGNHGGALAKAARQQGRNCIVVMPENTPEVKTEAVKAYGAEIIFCSPNLESRETVTNEIIDKTGAVLIHPYNNFFIIAGQGTAALELMQTQPGLENILAPVGGGGLLSGTAIIAKGINNKVNVFGAEPKGADDAYRSFKTGRIIPSVNPKTIADGLLTSLGELTFEAIRNHVDEIVTVNENSIVEALKLIWMYLKIVVEPSAAVPLAVILENKHAFRQQKTGLILSGGNINLNHLPF